MSKYLLFLILLISFTSAAQLKAVQNSGIKKINQSASLAVSPTVWDEQEPYVNGFARVLSHDKFGFINRNGAVIASVEFDGARNFKNHLAAVSKNNKWGFINEAGKIVIPLIYDVVFDFTESITGVLYNKKWLFINTRGEVLHTIEVTSFYGFNNGVAKINKDGRWGTVNTKGEISFTNAAFLSTNKYYAPFQRQNASLNSAVTACPDNIDFEFGNFQYWQCYTGRVDSVGTTNVITVTPSAPTANRHTLYTRKIPSAIDPFGLFPTNPPDGSNFALKLGNTKIGAEAERVRYTIHVPANDSNFSIKYDYAVVFEDPGHTIWTQPRFTVRVFDSAANAYVDCASFEYISVSNLPGFARSTVDTGVMYKPWSSVFLSLRGRAGKTMYLEFTTADCVRKGHWGYAYVDVEKPCGQSVEIDYQCDSPHVTTLTGPVGFQTYNWWDSSFSNIIATGQNVTLNPGPPLNTTVWLEMIPYNNFGCTDTLPVKITGRFNATFNVSDTTGTCAPHSFTFYNTHLPSNITTWDFGDGTFGTGDTVTHIYTLPGNYIVKLHAVLPSGCIGDGIRLVTVLQPTGSFSFDQAFYCNSQTAQFDAVVSGTDSLFWNFGDGTTLRTLQTSVQHTYTVAGIYIPTLTVQSLNGCQSMLTSSDTIKVEILRPGFRNTILRTCGSTKVNFTDTSYSYFGISSWKWNFGDGNTGSGAAVSHTYTTPGTYNVRLIITGISGCIDTIIKPVVITVFDPPVATISGDTVRCQNASVPFTSSVTSLDAINYYRWTSSNGATGSAANITIPFTNAGTYTVQLIAGTVNGCFDTTTHQILINPTPDVLQPPSQTLCNGDMAAAINFSGSISGTTYTWTNTGPIIGIPSSGSGNIAAFTAHSNGAFLASAGITVRPMANGCPGNPKTFSITVYPTPTVNQPLNQVLCNGSSTNLVNFTSAVAGTNFSWINSNPAIGLPVSGTGSIASFTAINTSNAPITATITVSPEAGNCPGIAKTFTITVNPTPTAAQPADQQLCNGSMTNAVNFTGAVSGTVYNWTNTNPSIGLAASGSGNIPSFAAVTGVSATSTATVTVSPIANGCSGTPKSFDITVSPVATVNQPTNQILCNGSATSAVAFTGLVPGTIYQWTNSNASIGLAASGAGDINAFTATNTTNAPITATITVTPVTTDCPGAAKTFTITINPTPDVAKPADQVLCAGAMTNTINFTGGVSTTVYNWTNTNPSIGLAATGTGNIGAFAALSSPSATTTAMITVNPMAYGCPGAAKTFSISVNPVPTVAQPASQVLCDGQTVNGITFTGIVPGTVYKWTNTNTTIGLPASGTGDISAFSGINKTNLPVTATITVTPQTTDCPGAAKTFTIIIHPTPDVVAGNSSIVCLGKPVQLTASGAAQYSWTPSNYLSCANCSNPVAIPADSILYTVKGTSAFGCIAYDSVRLSVIKPFKMQVSPDDTLCIGGSVDIKATNAGRYLWSPATGLNRTDIADPQVRTNVSTTFRVIGFDNYNCFTDTGYVNIKVGPKPTVTLGPDRVLATGTPLQLNAITSNGPIVKWEWTPAAELSCNNCSNPSTVVRNNSFYSVLVTNNYGCTATDTILINSLCKSAQVFIPNAFTPDGDGLNDVLMVRGRGVTVKSFRIFNRWGELVFERQNFFPDDPKNGWDGKVRGVPATPDVFVYTAEVFCDNGVVYTYKGNTTILK